ncbi:MAG TPA: phosphatidylglycerophosphatase A [Verrucomicrobiae bacterium]|nr:phosphatidylglycerophosphatase A [Verrucomicrobiae bacterium]
MNIQLWIAQGFGIGRIPVAPGTFGSVLGLLWFWLLLLPGNLWVFLAGTAAGLVLSIWLCGAGEQALKETDPGSIVFDEIAALPLCFLGWVLILFVRSGSMPEAATFFSRHAWYWTAGVFGLFRIFDVWKPWPVRQSQNLPGGLGVTTDDALAAIYVNVVVLVVWAGCQASGNRS